MNNVYKNYSELSQKHRLTYAKDCCMNIIEYLKDKKFLENAQIIEYFYDIFKIAVSADLNTSNDEHSFFNSLVGLDVDYQQFFDRTNHGASQSFINNFKNSLNSEDRQFKKYVYSLILHILHSDGPLNDKETNFFNDLIK